MRIRIWLLVWVILGLLVFGIAISIWFLIPREDPVDRLVALIRRHNIGSPGDDYYISKFHMGDAELGNRAAPRLLELLDDDDPEVRWLSAVYITGIGADADLIIPKLLEKLRDPDQNVRFTIMHALSSVRPTSADVIDAFLEHAKGNDSIMRITAACALTDMPVEKKRVLPIILPILIEALHDSGGPVNALGRLGPDASDAIPKLHQLAATHKDDYFRTEVVTALRKIEGESDFVISTLIDLLKCDYGVARNYAARTLGEIGPPAKRAIPALEYILEHPPKPSPDSSPPPPTQSNSSKTYVFPWKAPPTTGTVGEMPQEEHYAILREAVIEALKKIRE
jgi:HEAT repeat protein